MKLKTICLTALLTALYFVLSLTLKIPLGIGNISLDLGYVALIVAAVYLGAVPAMIVGAGGAFLESMLLSAYGISIGWVAMNAIVGLICGMLLYDEIPLITAKDLVKFLVVTAVSVAIGAAAKMIIECNLYSIPYLVKLPKILTAFTVDTLVIWLIGVPVIHEIYNRYGFYHV